MRLAFQFVGTVGVELSLDAEEFKGLSLGEVGKVVIELLQAQHPGVNFCIDDIGEAAHGILDVLEVTEGADGG